MAQRTQKLKFGLAALAAVSVIAIVWVFYQFRQTQGTGQIPLPPKAAAKAIMALSKVHQTATKEGAVQWELDAENAALEAGTGKMVLQSPQVTFFLEDGTRAFLTAREGVLNTRSNDMEVRGNVVVRNSQYTLRTESMEYQHDLRVMSADVPVKISSRSLELQAATMRFDLNTNQTHFSGQVLGILHENPEI